MTVVTKAKTWYRKYWGELKEELPVRPAYLLEVKPHRKFFRKALGYRLMSFGSFLFMPVPFAVMLPLLAYFNARDAVVTLVVVPISLLGMTLIGIGYLVREIGADIETSYQGRREPVE